MSALLASLFISIWLVHVQGQPAGGPGTRDPGLVRYIGVTLERILEDAFDVTWNQVSGPEWIAGQRYDISAKVPDNATRGDLSGMLWNLLVERLHFAGTCRPGTCRVMSWFGASEPKLKRSEDPSASPAQTNVELTGSRTIAALFREVSTAESAHWLGSQLGEEMLRIGGGMRLAPLPIADKTGLAERYDFDFHHDGEAFTGLIPEGAARNHVERMPVDKLILGTRRLLDTVGAGIRIIQKMPGQQSQ